MWRAAVLAALCLLSGCAPRGPDAATARQLRDFDSAFTRMQDGVREKLAAHPGVERDYRGRTFREDMSQWVMPESIRLTLAELRKNAAATANRVQAKQTLEFAHRILRREFQRSQGVVGYWFTWPAGPHWRRHWNLIFEANRVPVEPPDPALLAIEARMSGALDQGEFGVAANEARAMQEALDEAMSRTADSFQQLIRSVPDFSARKTPCRPGVPPDPARSAATVDRSVSLETYYPSEAKRRGEQGALILRVRVDEKGCGTQVAVLVRSGFESIDRAALQWFEAARFSPGTRAGRPVVTDLIFKVRFRIIERRGKPKT